MKGSTATGEAPSVREAATARSQALEETGFGRKYVDLEPATRYDLLVVGMGGAGIAAAREAAGLGARVAVVGRELPGPGGPEGRRVPAEALLRSARAIGDARLATSLGLCGLEGAWFDYPTAFERARVAGGALALRQHPKRLRELGLDLFVGEMRFTSPRTLLVGKRSLCFDKAILANDALCTYPDAPGLLEVGFVTPDSLELIDSLPARLAVLGAGPEGCELAQAFARFGSKVTLVDSRSRILVTEDADAVAVVRRALVEDGVRVLEGFEVRGAESSGGARRLLLAETESGSVRPLDVDVILIATGRAPDLEGLGLERAEVATGTHGIQVDSHLRTTNERIFATGAMAADAVAPGLGKEFEHPVPGTAHAHLAVQNALCLGRGTWDGLVVPRYVLTDPEVVHVGLRRRQAEHEGLAVETFRMDLAAVERAIVDAEDEGFLKIHTQRKTGRIVGATLVARHAGESLDLLTLALRQHLSIDRLASLVRPRPTQSAAVARAAEPFVPRHVPLRIARWVEAALRLLPRKR